MYQPSGSANQATGNRRLSLTMLAARDLADQFTGVARGTAKPFKYLAAFQEAEPYLGLPSHASKLLAWLVKKTMPQDWEEGSRPIAWPSAIHQAEFLAISPARVKVLNRVLAEAGILVMRDSPTGKRYGRRDDKGRIIEAFGFDLSPIAQRHEEFVKIAAEAAAEREAMRKLKSRATCARRAIAQVGETFEAEGEFPAEWSQLAKETADLVAIIRSVRLSEDLALIVKGLESRKQQAEEWLKKRIVSVDINPTGLENEPHTITTNPLLIFSKNTVDASEGSSRPGVEPISRLSEMVEAEKGGGKGQYRARTGSVEELQAGELMLLAPKLADLLPQKYPDWRDIVDAAGSQLCPQLGISQALWGKACVAMGRPIAAVAVAIVSTKPKEYFSSGAGGYFAGMVKRHAAGELNLDRTIWKLRRDKIGAVAEAEWH